MIFQGIALVPGACGELVQGTCGGQNFLVSCPVNWYSKAVVTVGRGIKDDVFPRRCTKAASAVRKMLDTYGYSEFGAVVEISSGLPVGKGMASSTADVAAACYAAAFALKLRPEPRRVIGIALSIEPTDGTFSSGITLFDHVRGSVYEVLGDPPPLGILALDFGGAVDTVNFNRRPDLAFLNRLNEPETARALELVRLGIGSSDPVLLGEGATISTLANQKILPKPGLEKIIEFSTCLGAYGVNVAHSGTVVGVLLPAGKEDDPRLIRRIRAEFPAVRECYPLRLVKGGPRSIGNVRKHTGNCRSQKPARRESDPAGKEVRVEPR